LIANLKYDGKVIILFITLKNILKGKKSFPTVFKTNRGGILQATAFLCISTKETIFKRENSATSRPLSKIVNFKT
jgi:hypothetical protein